MELSVRISIPFKSRSYYWNGNTKKNSKTSFYYNLVYKYTASNTDSTNAIYDLFVGWFAPCKHLQKAIWRRKLAVKRWQRFPSAVYNISRKYECELFVSNLQDDIFDFVSLWKQSYIQNVPEIYHHSFSCSSSSFPFRERLTSSLSPLLWYARKDSNKRSYFTTSSPQRQAVVKALSNLIRKNQLVDILRQFFWLWPPTQQPASRAWWLELSHLHY